MNRGEAKPKILVRKARSSDRETVFDFCRKTFSWGDYIPRFWDSWLKDEKGRLFVATINGVPVGIMHLSIDKPREAWLRAARTNPDHRRVGIATALTKRCLEYARRKDVKIVRLETQSDNLAAQAVLKKVGFKPVAEFIHMRLEKVVAEKSRNSKWADTKRTEAIWNYVQSSECFRQAARLYTIIFHYYSLGKQDLKRFTAQRKAIVHENRRGEIDGVLLIDDTMKQEWHENTIQTSYVDGNHNSVSEMAKFLKNHAHAQRINKIHAFIINNKTMITAFQEVGFVPEDTIDIIYAKKIQYTSRQRVSGSGFS
jgi:RimJ/RimL family protein N-acetyltransferase